MAGTFGKSASAGAEPSRDVPSRGAPAAARDRLVGLVEEQADFVWRSLRRLGVPSGSVDDATQQVFIVAQQKLGAIVEGKERAFLFGVAMNVASHARRACARRREELGEALAEAPDPAPLQDAQLDEARARALLDEVLDAMPIDLRTAFVLHELEEMTMAEISEVLAIPPGTVASRLRRARDEFHKQAQRVRARVERTTVRPGCAEGSMTASGRILCAPELREALR